MRRTQDVLKVAHSFTVLSRVLSSLVMLSKNNDSDAACGPRGILDNPLRSELALLFRIDRSTAEIPSMSHLSISRSWSVLPMPILPMHRERVHQGVDWREIRVSLWRISAVSPAAAAVSRHMTAGCGLPTPHFSKSDEEEPPRRRRPREGKSVAASRSRYSGLTFIENCLC